MAGDSAEELVIEAQGLTKRFGGKTVVDGVDMTVRRGEIYGFLGPNGSGKTTFIRMLCGLLTPDDGGGRCLGYDIISDAGRIRLEVGYMAQRFSLYGDLTVRENLAFIARLYRLRNAGKAVGDILDRMGLNRFADKLADNLSGGWKQRLALASCMLHKPKLLLLDEPTAGVDPAARRTFWDQVHHLAAEGITALISTHYMDEAERCHRLAYIAYGNLLARGTAEQLIKNANLTTWRVSGADLSALADELKGKAAVQQVAAFGNSLHISGTDPQALERDIAPFCSDQRYRWRKVETSLEELFISLMSQAGVNHEAESAEGLAGGSGREG